MDLQKVRKQEEMFSAIDNFDNYDITDCLNILKYLQTFDSQVLQTDKFQKVIYKLESRIKFLVKTK